MHNRCRARWRWRRAQRYAREIVPAFNAYMYFRVGYWIGKKLSQALYRVRIGYTDDAGLAAIPEHATVVFVMNHRSNMDYIIAVVPRRPSAPRCPMPWANGRACGACSS